MEAVERGRAAVMLHGAGIAVLDPEGNVTWADDAWAAEDVQGDLPRAPIGTNLLKIYRGHSDPRAQAVANAIAAVFAGKATYFEIEHRASSDDPSILTSVAALRGAGRGAVLIHRISGERTAPNYLRSADVRGAGDGLTRVGVVERLTPREREVLDSMAAGLDNRAIAAKLGIQYTTVRGHVRSVIEKSGARSRLEAVARAYQNGWVAKP
jgi:DNA-binding NarL/FixJ family response regulator